MSFCSCAKNDSSNLSNLVKIGMLSKNLSDPLTKLNFLAVRQINTELTRMICESLKLNCVFELLPTEISGDPSANGSWTGFLGMLQKGQYNTSLPNYSTTIDGLKSFNFPLTGFYESQILVTRDTTTEFAGNFGNILKPLKSQSWLTIISSVFILAVLITIIEKLRHTSQSVFEYIMNVSIVLIVNLARKGHKILHSQVQAKSLIVVWGLTTIVLTASFTSGLLSSMLQSHKAPAFTDFMTFIECVEADRCTFIHHSENLFMSEVERSSPGSPYHRLKTAFKRNGKIKVAKLETMLEMIKKTRNKFLVARLPRSFLLFAVNISGLLLIPHSDEIQTFIFRKKDPLKDAFSRQLLNLESAGLLTKIFQRNGAENRKSLTKMKTSSIQLVSFASPFMLLSCGFFIAGSTILCEHILKKRLNEERPTLSIALTCCHNIH